MSAILKFPFGHILMCKNALDALTYDEILAGLLRHLTGDWGEVCADIKSANELALIHGARILSVYQTTAGVRFWVVTEGDRSATTVFLPEDADPIVTLAA